MSKRKIFYIGAATGIGAVLALAGVVWIANHDTLMLICGGALIGLTGGLIQKKVEE